MTFTSGLGASPSLAPRLKGDIERNGRFVPFGVLPALPESPCEQQGSLSGLLNLKRSKLIFAAKTRGFPSSNPPPSIAGGGFACIRPEGERGTDTRKEKQRGPFQEARHSARKSDRQNIGALVLGR